MLYLVLFKFSIPRLVRIQAHEKAVAEESGAKMIKSLDWSPWPPSLSQK